MITTSRVEHTVIDELVNQNLIQQQRSPVIFEPKPRGTWYKKLRAHFLNHIGMYFCGGVAALGTIAAVVPDEAEELVNYISIAGGVLGVLIGVVKPSDQYFLANPRNFTPKVFRKMCASLERIYDTTTVDTRRQLDRLVALSRAAEVIHGEFPEDGDQSRLGIIIGRTADAMSNVGVKKETLERRVLKGFGERELVHMIRGQEKPIFERDRELMACLSESGFSDKDVLRAMQQRGDLVDRENSMRCNEALQRIEDVMSNFELALTIDGNGLLEDIGREQSRGMLRVQTSLGNEGASYMGLHAKGKDFPRIFVGNNVGPGFMYRSKIGLGKVCGNAGHHGLSYSTGGIAIVDGEAEHHFCADSDDIRWPVLGITYGGITQEPREKETNNALIISLNADTKYRNLPLQWWRFKDGKKHSGARRVETRAEEEETVGRLVSAYFSDWKSRRQRNEQKDRKAFIQALSIHI